MHASKDGGALAPSYSSFAEFIAGDPARHSPERDFGRWRYTGGTALIIWIPRTSEVVATPAASGLRPVEVLGRVQSEEALIAALLSDPDRTESLAWARERIRTLPTDPEAIARFVDEMERARNRLIAEERERRRRAYRVVAVAELPGPGVMQACADGGPPCAVCRAGDWSAVAAAAIAILSAGIDPLDRAAVERAAAVWLDGPDVALAVELLREPIEVHGDQHNDGRHRTHALKRAGVAFCVAVLR
jgi:hypothetical protein